MDNKEFISSSIHTITLDVTYKCNLRCLHCFNSSGEHNFGSNELNDDELFNIVKQVSMIKELTAFCFCGGETLLRKDIILKCAEYLRNNNNDLSINMVSNGLLMTKEIASEIKKAGVSVVQISLDGATEKNHDWLRNKAGAYEKAIKAIQYLVDSGMMVGVACTPTKRNIDEIEEVIALCNNLGVSFFRMQPIMSLGRANENLEDKFPSYMEYRKLVKKLNDYQANQEDGQLKVEWGDPINHLVIGKNQQRKQQFLTIGGYGDILASPYLPMTFGNFRNGTLKEYLEKGLEDIWSLKSLQKIANYITDTKDMDISKQKKLPRIFTGEDIKVDLLKEGFDEIDKRILEEYL